MKTVTEMHRHAACHNKY